MMAFYKILILILGGMFLVLAAFGLHRWFIALEKRGYIYYKEKPESGGGSVFLELDKLTRPNVEHTIEAKDKEKREQENDGE